MRFPRRRRRPARASNSQAARMPSGLTFRRRRPRSEPAGPAADRRPTRLSFRGPRRRRENGGCIGAGDAARAQLPPRNSRKATGGGTDRRAPGLSFRRPRAKRSGALLERLPRWLAPRGPRTAASETPADRPPRGLRLRRRKRAQAPGPPKRRTSIAARGLALRLAALGFAACMLQLLIVSQISILGVSADVTPLVVVAAGFLCGSLPGAVFGFARRSLHRPRLRAGARSLLAPVHADRLRRRRLRELRAQPRRSRRSRSVPPRPRSR
jgi:hypothetical protein